MNVSSIAVKVYRGDEIEAVHQASVAVVDSDGKLSRYFGDPSLVSMTRSCIKPFQLAPLLMTGAADDFEFSPIQLAIMCGSHTGTDEHRKVVQSNLQACRCTGEDLQCGCHWPIGMMEAGQYPLKGEDKDSLRHNCSGKHSGFIALAQYLGDDVRDYLSPESKAQQLVKKAVSDYCEYSIEMMPFGIDGCSAPNFPIAIENLALGFKKLACLDTASRDAASRDTASRDTASRDTANCDGADVLCRIRQAMVSHPEMVSGEGRFDLALARSFPDNVVCKIGAESIEGIGFTKQRIGIGVKVLDGNSRALGPICVAVLKKLGIIGDIDDYPLLKKYEEPEVVNVRGIVTGRIEADFVLSKV